MGTARGDRQHGTAQYNTTQYRNGRAKRREGGGAKSRHIKSSQVRLQKKKSKPPDKNAVEGGGAGRGREGHFEGHGKYITKRKLCPVPISSGIAAVPKVKFELLKWTFGVPARRVQGPALACDLLPAAASLLHGYAASHYAAGVEMR